MKTCDAMNEFHTSCPQIDGAKDRPSKFNSMFGSRLRASRLMFSASYLATKDLETERLQFWANLQRWTRSHLFRQQIYVISHQNSLKNTVVIVLGGNHLCVSHEQNVKQLVYL